MAAEDQRYGSGRQRRSYLIAEIERRPAPEIMKLADYGRDSAATEFLIQVGEIPCGKLQFSAVGMTKADPHLHALGSAAHPDKQLVMPKAALQALEKSPGPTRVIVWDCRDHGSNIRTNLSFRL